MLSARSRVQQIKHSNFHKEVRQRKKGDSSEWSPKQWTASAMYKNKWRGPWKKLSLLLFVALVTFITLTWDTALFEWYTEEKENLNCFELPGNRLPELNENEPKLGSGIYFHETSCHKDISDISLNPRQACSVESALRAHPYTDVFLLISSPILTSLEESNNILVQQLLSYRNFKLRHIKFSKYLSNTPLKVIHTSGVLNSSLWPVAHSSDVLRYATLYKFGGIYLDLDVIVLKPLIRLKNFAGAESNDSLGSGILGFGYDSIGREVATKCAQDLARSYNGKIWGFNGPGVITRVLEDICQTRVIWQMFQSRCKGFKVYPVEYFSALSFNDPEFFFQEGNTEKAREILNRSLVIHYWNKMSSKFALDDNRSDVPFLKYAQQYCPRVYEAADGYF